MLLDGLKFADLLCVTFEENTGATYLVGKHQVRKHTKYVNLNHHIIHEFTWDIDGVQQGVVYKAHAGHNTSGIGTKNIDANTLNWHDMESDLGVPMVRERAYGKNRILN